MRTILLVDSAVLLSLLNYSSVYGQAQGLLTVTLEPREAVNAGGKWKISDIAFDWQDSGKSVTVTVGKTYHISYKDIDDCWVTPNGGFFTIDRVPRTITGTYQRNPACLIGSLRVFVEPIEVRLSAQWKLDDGAWKNHNDYISGIPVNQSHTLYFKQITNWKEPQPRALTFRPKEYKEETGIYSRTKPDFGSLTVIILPSEARDFDAAWRLNIDPKWHPSGFLLENLVVGSFTLEFREIQDWAMDSYFRPITINKGSNTQEGTYRCVPLAKDVVYVDGLSASEYEKGNGSLPFKTITNSLPFINRGGRLLIKTGNYPENVTLNNRMFLESRGGVVVIGK